MKWKCYVLTAERQTARQQRPHQRQIKSDSHSVVSFPQPQAGHRGLPGANTCVDTTERDWQRLLKETLAETPQARAAAAHPRCECSSRRLLSTAPSQRLCAAPRQGQEATQRAQQELVQIYVISLALGQSSTVQKLPIHKLE